MAAWSLPTGTAGAGHRGTATLMLTVAAVALVGLAAAAPAAPAQTDPPSLPRPGDLTLGGRAGSVLVGLTVRSGEPGPADVLLHVVPLGSAGEERLPVELRVDGVAVPLDRCAATCRRAVTRLVGGEIVQVAVGGEDGGTAEFALPDLPAPAGGSLLDKATRRMRMLESYRVVEQLAPPDPPVRSEYAIRAPDRLRFEMETGQQTVRIGERMFIRHAPDDDWEIRSAPNLEVPNHIWDEPGAVAVRVVGREAVDGAPTDVIAFMVQVAGRPIWYRLWVDEAGLVPRAEMRARGHFMDHRYYAFDEPVDIQPPVGRTAIVRHELLGDRPALQGAAALNRVLLYGATLVAAGGVAFLRFLAAPGLPGRLAMARRVVLGAAVGVAAALMAVPLEVVIVGGDGVDGLVRPSLWRQVAESAVGARTALAVVGFIGLLGGVSRWAQYSHGGRCATATPCTAENRLAGARRFTAQSHRLGSALAGGVAVVAAQLAAGHSIVVEPAVVALAANFAHLAAAAVWVGGLALLPVVLRESASGAAVATVARFSAVAGAAVAVFAVAGAVVGWQHTGGLAALGGTAYGWTLLAKVGMVAAVVAVAAYNHRWLVPAIRRGDGAAWQRLRRTVRVEAVGVVLVLMVTAGLVDLPLPAG